MQHCAGVFVCVWGLCVIACVCVPVYGCECGVWYVWGMWMLFWVWGLVCVCVCSSAWVQEQVWVQVQVQVQVQMRCARQ